MLDGGVGEVGGQGVLPGRRCGGVRQVDRLAGDGKHVDELVLLEKTALYGAVANVKGKVHRVSGPGVLI